MSSTQIDSLNIRIESTSRDATAAIDALIQSFERLKKSGNFSSIEKSLKKISQSVNGGLKNMPKTFDKAAKAAKDYSSSVKAVTSNTRVLDGALSGASSGLLEFVGNAIGIHSLGQAFSDTLAVAMEWEGISARFGEGFGAQADEAYAHVLKLQNALYVNDQQFMQYASNFATLGKGMGVPARAIKDMSIGLTELAYDIYSKNNDFYTIEESLDAVRSAYLGEIEPIRKAGISITEATLKEAAANYGLTMSVEKMTEAQKMQLRYKVMVDQAYASGTVGTYIKEINTAEGASRALKQQLQGLAQTIGGLFMPILSAVLPYIQAFVSMLTMALRAVGAFFGISIKAPTWSSGMSGLAASAGEATDAVKDTTGALGGAAKAAKKLKDYTMGFDELNVIKPQQETSGGGGGGGGGIGGDLGLEMNSLWTDDMIAAANMKADAIVQSIMTALQPLKDAIGKINFEPLITSVKRLWEALKPFAATIGEGLYWFLLNVLIPLAGYTIENIIPNFINTLAEGLENAVPLMKKFGKWFAANKSSIIKVTGYVIAFFAAFKAAGLILSALGAIGGFGGAIGGIGKVIGSVINFIGQLLLRGQSLAIIFGASGGGLTGVFSVLGAVLKSLLGAVFSPLSLIAIAIASTATVLAANWDKVVQVFQGFISDLDLPTKFNAIMTALSPLTAKLAGLQDLFTAIGAVGAVVFTAAMSVVAGVVNAVLAMLPPVIAAFGGLIDILSGVGSLIMSVLDIFGSLIMGIKALIDGDFSGAMTFFSDAWNKVKTDALNAVNLIFSGVRDVFAGLWAAVIDGLTSFVTGVIDFFKNLWNVLVGHSIVPDTINAIVEWFASLPGKIYGGLQSFVQGVVNWFKNAWTGIKNSWAGVVEWFGTVWTNIKSKFSTVGTWFKTTFTTAWTNIKNAWSSVKTWFGDIWTGIKGKFSSVGTWFKTTFQTAWTNIKNVFSGWASFFSGLWTKIKTTFSGLGTSLGNTIGGAVKTAINKVIGWIETTVNNAITKINGVINVGKKFGLNISTIKKITIPRMASGGFVDEGQLFIAREAGAEMVGSMNNRTTVANNDQIVEGISAGVYSAVLAAMSQSSGNNKSSINVYLDGRQITAAVEKHQRERGANIMTGGVTFGY